MMPMAFEAELFDIPICYQEPQAVIPTSGNNFQACSIDMLNHGLPDHSELTRMASLLARIRPRTLTFTKISDALLSPRDIEQVFHETSLDHLSRLSIRWQGEDSGDALCYLLSCCAKSLTSLKLGVSHPFTATEELKELVWTSLECLEYEVSHSLDSQASREWYINYIVANAPSLSRLYLSGSETSERITKAYVRLFDFFGGKLGHLKLSLPAYAQLIKAAKPVLCPSVTILQVDADYYYGYLSSSNLHEIFPLLVYLQMHTVPGRFLGEFVENLQKPDFLPRLHSLDLLVCYHRTDEMEFMKDIPRLRSALDARGMRSKVETVVYRSIAEY
ncbi:hypothetical protein P389DRAFT_108308 [Cystobasidium minutum MCA 4210]|uniref:uncharacterized protein n=1 Tax=Cystobasidium minutum MCA 4210 TaxID=1397322 RepID=UPI0034CF1E37|eukprot:jgi/Rhomi1/108308/CE108307_91